jgi:hypothetical protein
MIIDSDFFYRALKCGSQEKSWIRTPPWRIF